MEIKHEMTITPIAARFFSLLVIVLANKRTRRVADGINYPEKGICITKITIIDSLVIFVYRWGGKERFSNGRAGQANKKYSLT